ncbi:MAG TPA: hypothetical protein VME22_12655 [Solirubrobacteraceae bacterium]|nr:hypothetical protein [Solirubrobacteraceae bacterium]
MDPYASIAIGAFAPLALAVFVAAGIFRRHTAGRWGRRHERNPLHGSYALLLACVAAFLLYLTFATEHKVDPVANQAHPSVVIKVIASERAPTSRTR